VEPGESVVDAVRREVREETGLDLDSEPALLGTHRHLDGLSRPALSHYFRVPAPAEAPDAWEHVVAGSGEDAGLVFNCRFAQEPRLWPVQAVFR
jgi:8-oxo-dGTP pyrophosphatase MutT (NUDIX family)